MVDFSESFGLADQPRQFPFFIVGAQRSGTTLLGLIMNSHSQIAVPEAARFLNPLLNRRTLRNGLKREDLNRFAQYLSVSKEFENWNYDSSSVIERLKLMESASLAETIHLLYSDFAASEGKPLWGDKSLFFYHIDLLNELFPHASFIHIVRDGRDVFDSWRQMEPSRGHAPTTALDWMLKVRLIERAFARIPANRALRVRYEDLVVDPYSVVASICRFLSINFEEQMLSFHERSHQYIGAHHSKLIFKPIDAANKAKWRSRLSKEEMLAYDIIAGRYLEQFGYGKSGEAYRTMDRLITLAQMVRGSANRAIEVISDARARRRALKFGAAARSIKVGEGPAERREKTAS